MLVSKISPAPSPGALRVVRERRLDGISSVAQIDELDALHDAAVLDVEAGDDPLGQHDRLRHGPRNGPRHPPTLGAPRRSRGAPRQRARFGCRYEAREGVAEIDRARVERDAADGPGDPGLLPQG